MDNPLGEALGVEHDVCVIGDPSVILHGDPPGDLVETGDRADSLDLRRGGRHPCIVLVAPADIFLAAKVLVRLVALLLAVVAVGDLHLFHGWCLREVLVPGHHRGGLSHLEDSGSVPDGLIINAVNHVALAKVVAPVEGLGVGAWGCDLETDRVIVPVEGIV